MRFKCQILAVLGLLLLLSDSLSAQTENDETEQIIESLSDLAEDYDYSELTERLNYYKRHPINLNKASREELQELNFLSPLQIISLLNYPKMNGDFIDLVELQAVEELDLETVRRLLPFVTLSANPFSQVSFRQMLSAGQHDLLFRYGQLVEKQNGFLTRNSENKSGYLGTPQRLFSRYRYNFQNSLSAGITMEKDAGESFFTGNPKGFDFYSGFIAYKGNTRFKRIVIGDYALQFGQGLTLWSGLSFGKGASIATLVKQDIGLRPYTSSNEALFFRGAAATISFKKFSITPFSSFRFTDATINEEGQVSSVNQSGYHRTATELKNKHVLRELIFGANIQYDHRNFKTGLIAYQTKFNHPFEAGKSHYNRYDFSGSQLTNLGVYYNYNWRNLYFFGEVAHSLNTGFAYLTGAMISVSRSVSLLTLYRNYQRNYHSFFNQAIAESFANNEAGFYSGITISPNSRFEFSGYTDFFRFPWLRFNADAPSKGYEFLAQLSYSPNKKIKTSFRFKYENKEENDGLENTTNFLEAVRKQNYRIELSYKINDRFQIKNRVEMIQYQKGSVVETGYLLYQDIAYHPVRSKFSGNARFAVFDTQGFNSRIYTYENDVLYGFSTPGFQDRGLKIYFNGRYNVKKGIDVWLRYAVTSYANKDVIGSGSAQINGSKLSDIKAQIRFQF